MLAWVQRSSDVVLSATHKALTQGLKYFLVLSSKSELCHRCKNPRKPVGPW